MCETGFCLCDWPVRGGRGTPRTAGPDEVGAGAASVTWPLYIGCEHPAERVYGGGACYLPVGVVVRDVVGARNSAHLVRLLMFVYEATEAVVSYSPVKLRRGVLGKGS